MKLRTIWTLPACTLGERLRRTRDWATMEAGARLPLRVKYWCTLQMIAKATRDSKNILETPLDEILKNLPHPKVMT